MDARRRKTIVYTLFGLALLWGAYNFSGNKREHPQPGPAPTKEVEAVRARPSPKLIDIEEHSSLAWGKDPFYRGKRLPVSRPSEPVKPRWFLDGILYDEKTPSAIINKKIVRNGDNIDGARVVQIDKQKVTLEKNGLRFTLVITKDRT